MRKKYVLSGILLLIFISLHGQEKDAKNAVYLELAGNGGAYSLNYERAFNPKFLSRVGFASWASTEIGGEKSITTIPVMVNTLFGAGSHKLEFGLGAMLGSEKFEGDGGIISGVDMQENIFALTGTAGYRYQKPSGGLMFRAGLTPFINVGEADYPGFNFSGGGSIGYAF